MNTTLYEVLEVSESASKEIIEKAYKVLAKKYHPDLQTPEDKKMAEQKMKQINEAYEILSNEEKRKAYDEELKAKREAEKNARTIDGLYNSDLNQNTSYANMQQNRENNTYSSGKQEMSQEERRYRDMQRRRYEDDLRKQQEKMRKQMENEMQERYENAYYNYLRSLGYRIKERWTWKKTKRLILVILIMIAILLLLWMIPQTHEMMLNIYSSNKIIKIIVDIIIGIVKALFQTIGSLFQSLFKGW